MAIMPGFRASCLFSLVAVAGAALLCGCGDFNLFAPARQRSGNVWTAATGLARSTDPAAAASAAVEQARSRLGARPVAAVLFFECFPEQGDGAVVAARIQAACTQAEVVGCSAGGVATADGHAADRAVAVLAVAGDVHVSSAYAPPSFASSLAAGQWLTGQLGGKKSEGTVTFVLAVPGTLSSGAWDAVSLLDGLGGQSPGTIAGGLAGGSRPLVCHAGRAFAGGVVALSIGSDTTDARVGWSQELLRIGPAWRASRVSGRTIVQLNDGNGSLPADDALSRAGLLAQDRPEGCLGRLTGERAIPLRFAPAAEGGLLMPVPVKEGERYVVLRPAGPRAADRAIAEALDFAAVPGRWGGDDATGPLTLVAAPEAQDRPAVLSLLHARLAGSPGNRAAVAFMSPGQFVSLPEGPQFASHLFAAIQIAPK
jgi:hypothetical protein